MNKAPVLSDDEVGDEMYKCRWGRSTIDNATPLDTREIQRDADHKHYQGIIREIFAEIESWKYVSPVNLYQCTMNEIIEKLEQSLKSKYQEEK